jgi:hypothetical protein
MTAGRLPGVLYAFIACAGLTAATLASSGTAAYILAVAAIGAAGILASLCRDWRHDTALTRMNSGPHPVPGRIRVTCDDVSDEIPLPPRPVPLRHDGRPLDDYEAGKWADVIGGFRSRPVPEPRYGRNA